MPKSRTRSFPTLTAIASLAVLAGSAGGASLPAFPGAEGFGALATGGRGGSVVKVTTLSASGPGSLQWAVDQPGARIVVFDVSGVIEGDVLISHGDLTIAGQTAPGAGITIHGHLYTPYGSTFGNLVIRHLRVRPPGADAEWPAAQHDAVQISTNHTIVLDHVDISHGIDENLDLWGGARDVTVQWSVISFPVYDGGHPDGPTHNMGMINGPGGGRISVHHNLFAHNRARTPALAEGPADVRNNVVYNGREGFVHHNPAQGDFNVVGNVYRDGPSATLAPLWFDPENGPDVPTRYWVWDNRVDDPGVFTGRVDNPYTTAGFGDAYTFACCGIEPGQFNAWGEFDFSATPGYAPITAQSAEEAYEAVLARAGAWPRDVVTRWAVNETRTRTGSWGDRRPADWLEGLTPAAPKPDVDGDGMADAWEVARGLDPADGTDHRTLRPSGYTAIEEYLDDRARALVYPKFADGFETGTTEGWEGRHP
jgi:pectate lyase